MKNEYGLDTDYFSKLIKREFGDISRFKPDEFARVCLRMAKTSDSNVINESEFASMTDLQKENDELRAKIDKYNDLSIILTNLELYGEDGHVQGVYLPTKLMEEFDALRYEPEAQSLAEVKAQAVRDYEASLSSFAWTAEEYISNQLKEG